jgi:Flp pilus assembly pilin Flp
MGKAMNRVRSTWGATSLARDERGLSTVEYVIVLVLIAASAIGLWATFGEKLRDKIGATNEEMDKVEIVKPK